MPALAARALLEAQELTPLLLVHPALEEDFAGLVPGQAEAVVVGDAGEGFTYPSLNRAFRALAGGAVFLALAKNRSFQDDDGARIDPPPSAVVDDLPAAVQWVLARKSQS
jgi:hypothetical protein